MREIKAANEELAWIHICLISLVSIVL